MISLPGTTTQAAETAVATADRAAVVIDPRIRSCSETGRSPATASQEGKLIFFFQLLQQRSAETAVAPNIHGRTS